MLNSIENKMKLGLKIEYHELISYTVKKLHQIRKNFACNAITSATA